MQLTRVTRGGKEGKKQDWKRFFSLQEEENTDKIDKNKTDCMSLIIALDWLFSTYGKGCGRLFDFNSTFWNAKVLVKSKITYQNPATNSSELVEKGHSSTSESCHTILSCKTTNKF